MILNSREQATVAWLVIFVALALTIKGVRSSVRPLLATLFSPKLLALFAIIISYNIAVVWWLWRVGYWDATMLYDTVVFVAVGGDRFGIRGDSHMVSHTTDGSFSRLSW